MSVPVEDSTVHTTGKDEKGPYSYEDERSTLLRQRRGSKPDLESEAKNEENFGSEVDSDDDRLGEPKVENLAKDIPQGTDHTPPVLTTLLSGLPPRYQISDRAGAAITSSVLVDFGLITKDKMQNVIDKWRNWVIRGIFTWLMIGGFCIIIWVGPMALMFTTLLVQVWCFKEIINIGYSVYRVHGLPWFRSLSWWFLITSNYFFYGESLVSDYFGMLFSKSNVLRFLITYHRFISFTMYIIGFVWFVLSLKKRYYMRQFSLFAWTHVALLIVVTQSYLIIINIFQGMIWFIVPVSMIVINDVMAYMFGFFFGKTPLIQLSPKKTWEGFIGGGISTVFLGMMLSYVMCQFPFFVCPLAYSETEEGGLKYDCEPSPIFIPQEYNLPETMGDLCALLGLKRTITMYPFVFHSIALSLFSGVIGPFGGFFASGFKRAFKIKDFGDVIPGHGGMMDRFDCQFLMATFVNVYIWSFIAEMSPQKLLQKIYMLKTDHQLELYTRLQDTLIARGHLQPS